NNDVPAGEIGNLLISGDSTCACYWNQHDKTRATIEGRWIRTGDKYYQDADGYYWYAGRTDDMLKVGGIWVSPVEVENALIDPATYKHWRVSFDGRVATITMDVAEDGGLRPGYKLKLNSYDLGVDVELHDILQRIRFEHPDIGAVVITSAKNRVFCSGANIYM